MQDITFEITIPARDLEKVIALARDSVRTERMEKIARDYVDDAIRKRIKERLGADSLNEFIDQHLENIDWNQIVGSALDARLVYD